MANSTPLKTKSVAEPAHRAAVMAVIAPAIGWLIPGAGHLVQRRWIRGILLFVSITSWFVLGLMMQGHIYRANGGDIVDIVGFMGDLGGGGVYSLPLAWTGRAGRRDVLPAAFLHPFYSVA